MDDAPPPPKYTEKQVIAATAITVCQGASVHLALTPGHSGVFGQDLQQAKAAAAWFRRVQPLLKDAQPYADVAIVLGTPAVDGPGLPAHAWGQAISEALGLDGPEMLDGYLENHIYISLSAHDKTLFYRNDRDEIMNDVPIENVVALLETIIEERQTVLL